ncbi:LuxR C-terminal-related transcriptional regulator [Kitasatospora sp. NPDC057015]|uniref:LuxR C-terminal-related transcriptional regulator n=1 Tax=Kitasatospora sp. NPDC057015 TaxID=3346001 RepID=UPI003644C5FC
MLSALGLDTTTEALYRAMLARPQDGVAALASALGQSEDDIRAGLDTLSELALARPSYEQNGQLRAVSPDIGMEVLMARQQAELAAQQHRVEASRAAAAQLISEYADLRPAAAHAGVEHLVGLDRIRERLSRLTRDIRAEVMSFSPDGAQSTESMEASRPLDLHLLQRGIRMRTLYLDSVRHNAPTVAYADWLAEHGGEVRTTVTLPTRMIIIDRTSAVIPVSSDDTAAGAVILTGHGTLSALCALFESTWTTARPLGSTPPRDTNGLTPQEQTVIRLLADGHTDEAIAKRLGVSPRTARRTATDLIERLNARSRFQAGVNATRAGWLPTH